MCKHYFPVNMKHMCSENLIRAANFFPIFTLTKSTSPVCTTNHKNYTEHVQRARLELLLLAILDTQRTASASGPYTQVFD